MTKLNDKEQEVLTQSRESLNQLDADAKLYVSNLKFRKTVDDLDSKASTSVGKKLRQHYYGEVDEQPAPTPQPVAEAVLAAAIKEFPKELCNVLFKKDPNTPGKSSSSLSREIKPGEEMSEYARAQLAAKFWKVIPATGSSVIFRYETSRDRQAKRDAAKTAEQGTGLPPGVAKSPDGIGFYVSDQAAYDGWKQKNSDRAVIAEAEQERDTPVEKPAVVWQYPKAS